MTALADFARALPRTLAGRVLLIIFVGLIVAHAASFALFEVERGRAIDRFAATDIAARIVESARSQAAIPPRPGPRSRLRWQEVDALPAPPTDANEPSGFFSDELRRLLAESFGRDPVAWLSSRDISRPPAMSPELRPADGAARAPRPEPAPGGGFRTGGPGTERSAKLVTVALDLPDGRKALAEAMLFQPSMQIPAEAWVSVALLFVLTALFSILAVRHAVRPVRMLADAADRLSRNIDEPPLPEKGAVEIRAAARAFNRMQDRLKRHVNSRALAFAAMSHDMRTPLTRMRLRLESLGGNAREKLSDDLNEIEALAKSALEVTRGLAPEEALARVDVEAFLDRLVRDYAAIGQRVGLEGSAAPIDVRPVALRRALANLVDNAVKYGKEVSIDAEDSARELQLSVCDSGPGIPAEDMQKVTYPFYRVESSRNRDTGGAGLGLAIAKDIVEGHGGELVLRNRASGGLCATIRLPRRHA